VAERDYFPCAFCSVRFNSVAERHTHELICPDADKRPTPPTERALPSPFVCELDAILTQGELYTMLRRAGLKLVDQGENRPYLLTVEPQSMLSRIGQTEAMRAAVNAEARRIGRAHKAWWA
jgi:hypothetical protein